MLLSARNFTSKGLPAFRLISVDGGHTLEVTLHDLMVASCLVRDGGLVVLDDFPNSVWLGVAEALMHFAHAQDRLVPFMHGYNKVTRLPGLEPAYTAVVAVTEQLMLHAQCYAQTVAAHALTCTECTSRSLSPCLSNFVTLHDMCIVPAELACCCSLTALLPGCEQVWFATKSHVQQYIDFMASEPETFTCKRHHESRRAVAGHVMCYTGPSLL